VRSARHRFIVAAILAGALGAAGSWACSAAPDGDVTELENDDALGQPGRLTSNRPGSADAGAPASDDE
jgi:hypothetical protein